MREDILRMSQRERQRYHLLWMVLEGRITLQGASERMGVSYRHAKRLKRRFRLEGAKGLVHGNRGRRLPHALDDRLKQCIIELSKGRYAKFNDTHFTGKLLEAFFIPYECSFGYLKLLEKIVTRYGIPLSIYQDRHSALCRNDTNWTLQEQLAGEQEPTQVGWALKDLGITPIFALTPQAKGRVERLFGVLQDRLIAEMGLCHIKEIEKANIFLQEVFIKDYNRRFCVEPEESEEAWQKVPEALDIKRIISFRYQAVVGNDNAVRLGDVIIDIPEGTGQRGYAKTRVKVYQLLDGSWHVYYKDKLIAKTKPTPLREPIRARPRRRSKYKAATEEQWIYLASAPQRGHIDFA